MIVARCLVVVFVALAVLALSAANAQPVERTARALRSRPHAPSPQPTRRGLGSAISYGAVKYPFLGFAVVAGGLTVANAAAVRATLHGREQDVLRRKKAQGRPAIDLTNEIKAAKEKYKGKLKAISSGAE